MIFNIKEENELEKRRKKHKKTIKKGAMGWFYPNKGDKAALDNFNNSVDFNSVSTADGSVGSVSMGEQMKFRNKNNTIKEGWDSAEYKDYESIEKFLSDNGFTNFELVGYKSYPLETSKISFEVDGDWKHDHLAFKELLSEWAEENDRDIFKIDSQEIGESDSDWYRAVYDIYIAKDKDALDKLNSMRRLFTEDTVKQNGKWVNKGKEGTHGKFNTKKEADAQRKAMFANGYREALEEQEGKCFFAFTKSNKLENKITQHRLQSDVIREIAYAGSDIAYGEDAIFFDFFGGGRNTCTFKYEGSIDQVEFEQGLNSVLADYGSELIRIDFMEETLKEGLEDNQHTATDVVVDLYHLYPQLSFTDERELEDGRIMLRFDDLDKIKKNDDHKTLFSLLDKWGVQYRDRGSRLYIVALEDENYLTEDADGGLPLDDPKYKGKSYLDILYDARDMENDAIEVALALDQAATEEDREKFIEIANDENDHDRIYADIIQREEGHKVEESLDEDDEEYVDPETYRSRTMCTKFIAMLPKDMQEEIRQELISLKDKLGITDEDIEEAMNGRLCDLSDSIDIYKYQDRLGEQLQEKQIDESIKSLDGFTPIETLSKEIVDTMRKELKKGVTESCNESLTDETYYEFMKRESGIKEDDDEMLKEALQRFTFTDGMEIVASSSDEAIKKYETIVDNRSTQNRPFEELDKIAQDLYDKEKDFEFHFFSDDELATLWAMCALNYCAYDDEVYDAISDFPNKDDIFRKAREIAKSIKDRVDEKLTNKQVMDILNEEDNRALDNDEEFLNLRTVYEALSYEKKEKIKKALADPNVDPKIVLAYAINDEIDEGYGGAFDIEDDQFFTREDLDEFGYRIEEELNDFVDFPEEIHYNGSWIDNNKLTCTLSSDSYTEEYTAKIDMRKIQSPNDLENKYLKPFVKSFARAFKKDFDLEGEY